MRPSIHHIHLAAAGLDPQVDLSDIWFYCRKHERAESVKWAMDGCERIGPFETADEVLHLIKRQNMRGQ